VPHTTLVAVESNREVAGVWRVRRGRAPRHTCPALWFDSTQRADPFVQPYEAGAFRGPSTSERTVACWTRTSSSPRPGWAPVGIQPGAHDGASRHTKWRDVATHLDDEDRWAAVVRRDRNADGRFYYSVRTTGVYCRPSCASRLARRENVRFHSTRVEAETAGFRPCKRCRPNAPALNDHTHKSWHRV